jgi:CxxC-x17-CxxC domain-containing protein
LNIYLLGCICNFSWLDYTILLYGRTKYLHVCYTASMRDFNRGNRSGGRRDFGGGGRSFDRPEMHKAVCSNCGRECEVPFRPTGSKPVFCRDCFATQRGNDRPDRGEPRRFEDRRPERPPEPHKEEFAALHAKLDKILSMVSHVTSPAPQPKENIMTEIVNLEQPVAEAPVKKAAKRTKKEAPIETE